MLTKDSIDNADPSGSPCLHLAVRGGHHEAVALLVGPCGADPQVVDKDGNAPIHLAVRHGNVEVIRLLLEAKADPLAENHQGVSALLLAVVQRPAEANLAVRT